MKEKNGFTLIELLAVILILGIIALIAIPTVNTIIKSAKENSAKQSVIGYVKAIDFAQAEYQAKHNGVSATDISKLNIDYKGDKVYLRSISIDANSGEVTSLVARTGSFKCTYSNEHQTCEDNVDFNLLIEGHLFTFENGMTWQDWFDSELYDPRIKADKNGVYYNEENNDHYISLGGGAFVKPTDLIQKGQSYNNTAYCFVAGTKVLTINGLKNIEDIKVGEMVYSYNEKINTYEYNKVLYAHKNLVMKDKTTIETKNDKIVSTSKHQYYTSNRGWVEANKLTINDKLVNNNGNLIEILLVNTITSNEEYYVYNLTVENVHNYYVGNNSILVHNAGAPTDGEC